MIVEGDYSDVFDANVKASGNNTYINVSKKYRGRKAKVLICILE